MGKLNLEKISVSEYKKKVSASEIDLKTIYGKYNNNISK